MVDDDRMKLRAGEKVEDKLVRFRTLGCYPLTGAIELPADTLEDIVSEMLTARTSERQGRLIDSDESASMEKKEARGLFLMTPSLRAREYLAAQEKKSLLRFLTCGSVDDGKSTLIGRLLYDSKLLFEDHLAALEKDSKKHGTTGGDIDFALLVDGLEAEREQGITIDVAYRFFATDRRKFIVADTPGHEQYTRNMATGASNSELAVILIDARKGVLTQTRRHAYIASLLGHPPRRAGRQQDRPGRFLGRHLRRHRRGILALRREARFRKPRADPDFRALRRQRHRQERIHALVQGTVAAGASGNGRCRDGAGRIAVPHARAMGQPSQSRLPRFLRHDRQRTRASRATPIVVAKSGRASKVGRIVTMDGDLAEAVPRRCRDADAGR